jgi:hypothetical protein
VDGMSVSIKSTLETLAIIREQLDNPDRLFERESYVKLPHEDKGLSALYRQIQNQASLQRPSANL